MLLEEHRFLRPQVPGRAQLQLQGPPLNLRCCDSSKYARNKPAQNAQQTAQQSKQRNSVAQKKPSANSATARDERKFETGAQTPSVIQNVDGADANISSWTTLQLQKGAAHKGQYALTGDEIVSVPPL